VRQAVFRGALTVSGHAPFRIRTPALSYTLRMGMKAPLIYLRAPNLVRILPSHELVGKEVSAAGVPGMKRLVYLLFALVTAVAQAPDGQKLNEEGLQAYQRGAYVEAEQLHLRAIQIWEKLGPDFEAHLATSKMNLAQALAAEGRRTEAAAALEESLAGFRHSLGPRDLRTLTTMNLLGGIYLMMGDYNRGGLLFEQALPIERQDFPADAQLARTLGGLACILYREKRPQEALPLAEESLRVALKATGEDSLDAALAYANVAEAQRLNDHPARALPLYRKSRAIYERILGPDHPRVGTVMAQEGLMALGDGQVATAERTLTRAVAIIEKACPLCIYERWIAQSNLALVRVRQGKYAMADRLFSEVLDLQEKSTPQPTADMAVTLKALAFIRGKEHKPEEAARLNQRASTLLSYR
jgi:tetratricopeptide (TPR) repeat protein